MAWEPGFRTVPHVHPRAEEVFHVLEGRAAFRIGSGEDRIVGPGTILLARARLGTASASSGMSLS
jgi:quercetin dioxygenase-like cupin family protein